MSRSELHQMFVSEFSEARHSPIPVPQVGESIERELGTVLPLSYISFLQTHGAPYTPNILDLIVKNGKDTPDIRQFLTAEDAVRNSQLYWSGGMSHQLIGFASDCMGSMFCFQRLTLGTLRTDDAEVWFFDHDYCIEYKLADSFDGLLLGFLTLKRTASTAEEVG